MFKPRKKQEEVIAFEGGKMGVSAVPGSGKTRTLSFLASRLLIDGRVREDQEILIVTLVNSAVDNFSRQISEFVREAGLLPHFGYRVRTLHGLANDIVRDRPSLVGLDENFDILSENEAKTILRDAALAWLKANPDALDGYLRDDLSESEYRKVRQRELERVVISIADGFIRQAKDASLLPEDIRRLLDRRPGRERLELAEMCWEIYAAYQHGLNYRGAVDFRDLIRLALATLNADEDYLVRLRSRWPYILEDEAQDSSALQEQILRMITGQDGNWVRVGDPNQAIYETFTTASPEYLRQFVARSDVQARELPNSGRSTKSIIKLANHLIDWSMKRHPSQAVREEKRPLLPPLIEPVAKGDAQPNPKDRPGEVHVRLDPYTPGDEIETVVRSAKAWIEDHPDETLAILVPRNDRGSEFVQALQKVGVPVVELLRSTTSARQIAGSLTLILEHLAQAVDPARLGRSFEVWKRDEREDADQKASVKRVAQLLGRAVQVETFVYPALDQDWLDRDAQMLEALDADPGLRDTLEGFRATLRRWQAAVMLPVDQLVLTLAQDLFHDPLDLAIAYSVAVALRQEAEAHPEWRLPDFASYLRSVARNERSAAFLSENEPEFDPDAHRGKVTVATMHKAKGLEWDRVYLTSVNNYDFPSDEAHDTYMSETWYVRDQLNLDAEARGQLQVLRGELEQYVEGQASRDARLDYVAERLRLLYVGITRARKELIITWNTGRNGDKVAASPLVALHHFWEKERS